MFKVDKVRSFFDCDQCHQLLANPVTIPCGNNICKNHLDDFLTGQSKNESTFKCQVCDGEHSVPKEGFLINKRMQSGIDMQWNSLKLSPVYEECKRHILEANANLDKIETLEVNSESFIYDYFGEIKRQVDLRREDLKLKIDIYSDKIFKSIECTQLNCIKLSNEANGLTKEIEKSKAELNLLIGRFDTFDIDEKRFEDIKKGVFVVNESFNRIQAEYNKSLLGDKDYVFDFKEFLIEDVFGCLKSNNKLVDLDKQEASSQVDTQKASQVIFPTVPTGFQFNFTSSLPNGDIFKRHNNEKTFKFGDTEKTFKFSDSENLFNFSSSLTKILNEISEPDKNSSKFDSVIMDFSQQYELAQICTFSKDQKWLLKYRATRDGFDSNDFHFKCDGIANTLTVIKTTNGNVFGGFAETEWHSKGFNNNDPNAFIFSLINKDNEPFTIKCDYYTNCAVACDSRDGPSFGGNNRSNRDIFIASNSNVNQQSYSSLGFTYRSTKAENILAGSHRFQTTEIEVFAKID